MGSHGAHHGKVTIGGKSAARNNGYDRPARSAELEAAVRDVPRIRGRKDTRRWCKGKPGREHKPQIVFAPWYGRECRAPAGWETWVDREWICQHREVCAACGKVLRDRWQIGKDECPEYVSGSGTESRFSTVHTGFADDALGAGSRVRPAS